MRFSTTVLVFVGGCVALSAQSVRELNSAVTRYVEGGELGSISVQPNSRELKWDWSDSSTASAEKTTNLDIASFLVGRIAYLGNRTFVVAGRVPSGDGVLARVRCVSTPARAIVVDEVKLYPGLDFIDVAWNSTEKRLYLVDYLARRVVYAAWNGPSAPLPGSTTVAVDSTAVPLLTCELVDVEISTDDLPAGFAVRMPPSSIEARVSQSGTTWNVAIVSTSSFGPK